MGPPLQIVVFYQPSTIPSTLAAHLFCSLVAGPDDAGVRIPLLYQTTPDASTLEALLRGAEHTLVVVLVDGRMARRVGPDAKGRHWADLVCELLEQVPCRHGADGLLVVALDANGLLLDEVRLGYTSFIRLDCVLADERPERLLFHVCAGALRLLDGGAMSPNATEQAPVHIFVSHAKSDLPRDDTGTDLDVDPVRALLLEMAQGPVEAWFDAKKIPSGGRFDHEIESGVLQSSALIAVVTNSWSSREWCRREVLEAKEVRRPMLVVDYITDEKPRLFPYLGNAPVMRWRDKSSARKAVTFAVREALRYRFQVSYLKARAKEGEEVFGNKPELLSVARLPPAVQGVLYPDPPLGEEELLELRRIAPRVTFTTPLTEIASFSPPSGRDRIALSLSTAPDAFLYGGSPEHLAVLAHDLNLFLMLAGFGIDYGGALVPDGVVDGEKNFVERLISIARSYSPILRRLGRSGTTLIQNYVGWPIHLKFTDKELEAFGNLASPVFVPRPLGLKLTDEQLGVASKHQWFPPDSGVRRFAWARGMTCMREAMRDASPVVARIVLGGKLTGYVGRYPGVLEEALLDLRKGRPVFLLGCSGGAARLVYDALCGRPREELTTAWVTGQRDDGQPRVPFYDVMRELHFEHGIEMLSPEDIANELATIGGGGIQHALRNGLDNEENAELAEARDPHRIVELVITGIRRLAERAQSQS